MCGIVGYVGNKEAVPILIDGLKKLEYRGYDSAGVAVRNEKNEINVVKSKGRIADLNLKLDNCSLNGKCGIGHTRWATHGEPNEINAHPHLANGGNVVGVHNGIIENYQELKDKLIKKGYEFYSETDTEVIVNLVDYYNKKYNIGPVDAIAKTMVRVRGSYALALMFKDRPGEIWVARKDSPMIIGHESDGSYVASDVPAILEHTKNVYYIDNLEMAKLTKDDVTFYDLNGDIVKKDLVEIKWDATAAEKDGYEHFMIKEIYEQPEAISKTINSFIKDDIIDLTSNGLNKDFFKNVEQIYIVACGSAYHAGVCAKYAIEHYARIPVSVEIASEFRYENPILNKNGLVIIISQSGETADSLAALRLAKEEGIKTLGIVNVVGSSIAREADNVLYTLAGPEIAVATTKAYSCQVITLMILALELSYIKKTIKKAQYQNLISEMKKLPDMIKDILSNSKQIQRIASNFSNIKDCFFIGRNLDYAVSLEGSLKMKEISYIHSEAYAAGELKHGTISLIENNTLVIGILTQDEILEKTISNLVEVKSRGAYVIALMSDDSYNYKKFANKVIMIPKTEKLFYPNLAVIPLQLLGYYLSVSKGLDVDKPRNLAKSVTVE